MQQSASSGHLPLLRESVTVSFTRIVIQSTSRSTLKLTHFMAGMQVWDSSYVRSMAAALEGPLLRTELAATARQLALNVLGSTGGTGNR